MSDAASGNEEDWQPGFDIPDDSHAATLVTEFCEVIPQDVDETFREQARTVAGRTELQHPINRERPTVAAASIYLVGLYTNVYITQADISKATGVSRAAIRAAYPEIAEYDDVFKVVPESRRSDSGASAVDESRDSLRRLIDWLSGRLAAFIKGVES